MAAPAGGPRRRLRRPPRTPPAGPRSLRARRGRDGGPRFRGPRGPIRVRDPRSAAGALGARRPNTRKGQDLPFALIHRVAESGFSDHSPPPRWAQRRGDDPAVFLVVQDRRGVWGLYTRADAPRPYLSALLSGSSARRLLRTSSSSSSPIPSGQPCRRRTRPGRRRSRPARPHVHPALERLRDEPPLVAALPDAPQKISSSSGSSSPTLSGHPPRTPRPAPAPGRRPPRRRVAVVVAHRRPAAEQFVRLPIFRPDVP